MQIVEKSCFARRGIGSTEPLRMFESLSDKLTSTLRNLRGVGKLSEENMADALKEVRTALLAADVHFKVARQFVDRIQEKVVGQEVLKGVTPGQQIIKIISDELESLLGEGETQLNPKKPLKVLMVGLHGSGKTTSTAKLATLLKKKDYRALRPSISSKSWPRPMIWALPATEEPKTFLRSVELA